MSNPVRTLVRDYGWIHTGIGMIGNLTFFAGSILFLPAFEQWKTIGVWLFIVGAFLMLIGSIGDLLVKVWKVEHPRAQLSR